MTANPTYGAFAGAIGLLVWINLVSRFLLLSAAWTATGRQPAGSEVCGTEPEEGFSVPVRDRPERGVVGPVPAGTVTGPREPASPGRVAGVLVGTGAVLGAGAATAGRRYLRRRPDPPTG